MNAAELQALARVDRDHWFYRGKRDIVHHWLGRLASLRPDDLVLDVGTGSGQLLVELRPACRTAGIELHPAGLHLAAARAVPLIRGSVVALPVASGSAAVVTALDVIEHVDDDARAVEELLRVTRPGGLLVIHVPAFPMLWSDWDESLGHRRRYTKRTLARLFAGLGSAVVHCAYVNTAAFLPLLAYRRVRMTRKDAATRRLEDVVPPAPLNWLLHVLFVAPARWRWMSPPFGTSILCILRKAPRPA